MCRIICYHEKIRFQGGKGTKVVLWFDGAPVCCNIQLNLHLLTYLLHMETARLDSSGVEPTQRKKPPLIFITWKCTTCSKIFSEKLCSAMLSHAVSSLTPFILSNFAWAVANKLVLTVNRTVTSGVWDQSSDQSNRTRCVSMGQWLKFHTQIGFLGYCNIMRL